MPAVLALDTPRVLSLVKIAPTTLNYWVEKGFCTPTLDAGAGNRATRFWTVHDVLVLRAIKGLRDAGCSLQKVALVEKILRDATDAALATSVLVYTGSDVLLVQGKEAVGLLKNRGQAAFLETVVTASFPVGTWLSEATEAARNVDVDEIRARRLKRRRDRGAA